MARPLIRPDLVLLAAALALIGVATLAPLPGQAPQSAATPFVCLFCGDGGGADFALNVVLFVPLGLALGRLGLGWRAGLLLAGAVTGAVEALQFTVIPGRDSALGDLVANTAGAGVGLLLARTGTLLLHPPRGAARVLLGLAALLPPAAAGAGAWLLQPSLPATMWYGQWAPARADERWFGGRLLAAELGGAPLSRWRLDDSREVRTRLLAGPVALAAEIVTGPPTPHHARIVSVSDPRHRLLELGQAGTTLRYAIRTRAQAASLRRPVIGLRDALPEADRRVRVEGRWEAGRVTLSARTGAGARSRTQALSVGELWSLLLPLPLDGGWRAALLQALWVAGLFLPLGLYRRAGRARVGDAIGAAGVVPLALWLVPALGGVPGEPPVVWLWALAGIAGGGLLGRLSRRARALPAGADRPAAPGGPFRAPGPTGPGSGGTASP